MDHQFAQWLKEDIEKLEARLETKFKGLDAKMDDMLKFKWQIVGGTMVVSFIIGIAMQLILFYLKNRS